MEAAIKSCIDDNIMANFLRKEKAGVIRMHVLDYNEEKHRESLIQEGISEKTVSVIRNMLMRLPTISHLKK